MNVTDKEYAVLRSILTNLYQPVNGRVPTSYEQTDAIWANLINEATEESGIEGKALSAIVGSLSKKGLIDCSHPFGTKDRDATITLTQAGFDAAMAQRGVEG